MAESGNQTAVTNLRTARLVGAVLDVGAVVLAAITFIWAVAMLWAVWGPAWPQLAEAGLRGVTTLGVIVLLLGGWAAALALWGLAELIRKFDRIQQSLETGAPLPPVAPRAPDTEGRLSSRELLEVLRDIRDLTLLDDDQRAARRDAQAAELIRELERDVPRLLREHNWVAARDRVRAARVRFPGLSPWEQLAQRVEQARSQVEAQDIEAARRQVDELAALGAWDRAVEVARELIQRHPDAKAADELAHRVVQERKSARDAERLKLMADAQAATDRREWRVALEVADKLIGKYPRSVEAEALRQQLTTLRDNAEIQTRQQMETRIRDLIKAHDYAAALGLARELIERFPHSPQAAVLGDQLARLEQKAAEQRPL